MSTQSQAVMDMVVDPVASHLYWVEYSNGRIQRSELNGTNVLTVISLNYLSTLAIDIKNRLVRVLNCRRLCLFLLKLLRYSCSSLLPKPTDILTHTNPKHQYICLVLT